MGVPVESFRGDSGPAIRTASASSVKARVWPVSGQRRGFARPDLPSSCRMSWSALVESLNVVEGLVEVLLQLQI